MFDDDNSLTLLHDAWSRQDRCFLSFFTFHQLEIYLVCFVFPLLTLSWGLIFLCSGRKIVRTETTRPQPVQTFQRKDLARTFNNKLKQSISQKYNKNARSPVFPRKIGEKENRWMQLVHLISEWCCIDFFLGHQKLQTRIGQNQIILSLSTELPSRSRAKECTLVQ